MFNKLKLLWAAARKEFFESVNQLLKFFNLLEPRSNRLSIPKAMSWMFVIAMGIVLNMMLVDGANLAYLAGILTALVAAFGVAYNLTQDKK
jgi:hypothetical protein